VCVYVNVNVYMHIHILCIYRVAFGWCVSATVAVVTGAVPAVYIHRIVVVFSPYNIYSQTVYNTKGTRAHTHRELIRTWLWEPKGSSLEYI